MSEQNRKVALITGANKGIGYETARQLGKQDIKILLGARDEKRGKEAEAKLKSEGLDIEFVLLDVNDEKTHETAAKYIEETYGKLDILVNNAGIVEDYGISASQGTIEQWRKTFETNVFNLVALTQTLLPLVKNSEAGRIVNLSSSMGSLKLNETADSSAAYNASKTAVNMFTVNLANELKDTPVKVNAADPGWVQTDMGGENAALKVEEGAKTSVALATLPDDGQTGKFVHLGKELPW